MESEKTNVVRVGSRKSEVCIPLMLFDFFQLEYMLRELPSKAEVLTYIRNQMFR